MYEVESKDCFMLAGKGMVFVVESPMDAPRCKSAYLKAIGDKISINGTDYSPITFEWFAVNSPVRKGESIGILVNSL